jgi:hypothetical protein
MTEDSSDPSLFRYILGFLAVGLAWGFTTPFMRQATINYKPTPRPELDDETKPLLQRKTLSLWYSVYDLVSRPAYSIPLLLNLSGSVWFFLLVGQAGKLKKLVGEIEKYALKYLVPNFISRVESYGSNHQFSRVSVHCPGRVVGRRKSHLQGYDYTPIVLV